jgi:hypothetical protein
MTFQLTKIQKILAICTIFNLVFATWLYSQNYLKPISPLAKGPIISQSCRSIPAFATKKYPGRDLAFDSGNKASFGLNLNILDKMGQINSVFQDETWKIGGQLGSFAFDQKSNLYIVPTPIISIAKNPAPKRNTIFKVDNQTGKMSEFLSLPIEYEDNFVSNPYGLLGIDIDCKTDKMYVSTIANSTQKTQNGNVLQIDVNTKSTTKILQKTDVYGVSIVAIGGQKYLYFGNTQNSNLYSLQLGGNFAPRKETLPSYSKDMAFADKIKKIRFDSGNKMQLSFVSFLYSLAPTEFEKNVTHNFVQNQAGDWVVVN